MPGKILLHLGVFLLYSLAVSFAAFLLPPVFALVVALSIVWGVLRFYLLPRDASEKPDTCGALRLRPLRGAVLGWTLAAAPVLLLLSWSFGELYLGLVPVPPRVLNPFGEFVLDPGRRLVLAVVAIAAAPVVEEFFFRGLIQHPLERRLGAGAGIGVAALLFALVHVDTLPWVIPMHFVLGAIFGWIVYVTRSIWAGVLMHAVNNCAAFLGLEAEPREPRETVWDAGFGTDWWLALGVLGVSVIAGAWVARRLRRASAA